MMEVVAHPFSGMGINGEICDALRSIVKEQVRPGRWMATASGVGEVDDGSSLGSEIQATGALGEASTFGWRDGPLRGSVRRRVDQLSKNRWG